MTEPLPKNVVPPTELVRRRELRNGGESIAHAEFSECVFEAQGGFPRTIRVGNSESVLSVRAAEEAVVFCLIEQNRVFLAKDREVRELPVQDNSIEAVIRISRGRLRTETMLARKLSTKKLAEVADTFQQVLRDSPDPAV